MQHLDDLTRRLSLGGTSPTGNRHDSPAPIHSTRHTPHTTRHIEPFQATPDTSSWNQALVQT